MPLKFTSLPDIYAAAFDTVIDVRSPAEYAEDHIPGAISLPALSNEQRAIVGTIYVQEAPFKARKIGAAMVARNAADHIDGPLAGKDGAWQPLVYCWRGGQRSGSFASILKQIGWRADTIEGGYQSYRRLVVKMLHDTPLPHPLIVLDGNTGTAKTEILLKLADHGVQVVDLEGLAAHRGSLFGAVARPQPAQKGFETALAQQFSAFDPSRPVVVEAESSKVGNLMVPPSIWAAMRAAPRLRLTASLPARARYLTRAYSDLIADAAALQDTLAKLVAFHGREHVAAWQMMAQNNAFEDLAGELMAKHYDNRYAKSRAGKGDGTLADFALTSMDDADLNRVAKEVADVVNAETSR